MASHHAEDVRVTSRSERRPPRRAVAASARTRQPTEVRRRLIVE
ncbi:TetR family transcriptional regulator, partial [Streptomyces sp. SID8382]|nr:TetR family transcriptional regulator [Streptomyces sp. SID8382]